MARSHNRFSRNVVVASGQRTSVRLESVLWAGYDEICGLLGWNRHELVRRIDERRPAGLGLTGAIRVFLVSYFRAGSRLHAPYPGAQLVAGLDALGGVVPPSKPRLVAENADMSESEDNGK